MTEPLPKSSASSWHIILSARKLKAWIFVQLDQERERLEFMQLLRIKIIGAELVIRSTM